VPAKHDDDGAPILFCVSNRFDDASEIARDQNVRKGFQECGEAAILAGW
jgi:hypothetical protein